MQLNIRIAIIWLWWLSLVPSNFSNNSTTVFTFGFSNAGSDSIKIMSRRRRYIVFPRGSSFQLVFCNTYHLRPVIDIFRFGMTLGLAWQLPDDPTIYSEHKKKHKIYKRNVFKKLETIMRHNGDNGQQCLLKALCESGQRTPSKKEFILEILHKIFSVNSDDTDEDDTHEDKMHKKAHNSINQNCDTLYPECRFSIFKMFQT